jgi:membrane associated rhomboid family serine protease
MTPWVTRLIIANAAVYLLCMVAPEVTNAFMFVPALALERPWTLVTYMFLHAGLMHILFNMLGLFFFGPRLEAEIGGRDFLFLYFLSGITGAIFSFITPYVAIVGASGAVYGVLLGFARYWPRERLFIYGILPVEARWLVVIITGLSLFGGFSDAGGGIAHFAHLGGFAGGYLYLSWRDRHTRGAKFQATLAPPPPRSTDITRWAKIDRTTMHEVNRAELERILEKIENEGVESLTVTERAFLDRFSPE